MRYQIKLKNMKKVVLLSALAFMSLNFISCSSDDDNGTPDTVDTGIYGEWLTHFVVTNGTYDEELECSEIHLYEFESDGDFNMTSYSTDPDSESGDCVATGTIYGSWEYVGEGIYSITPNGSTGESNNYFVQLNEDEDEMSLYTESNYNNGVATFVRFVKQ